MLCALRAPVTVRCANTSYAQRSPSSVQLLRKLAKFNPNQLSSYHGIKLLLPTRGRLATVPQGSAAARKPVQMSFLGVGAPEAILVAVVALVVFGPKGLADAARSLGATLRAFQPTIKEVVQVSQELKGTLEQELGINELREAARPTPRPLSDLDNTKGPAGPAPDVLAKVVDPDIEAKRAASAEMAWGAAAETTSAAATAGSAELASAATGAAAAAAATAPAAAATNSTPLKDISSMTLEELEAELNRRRAASQRETRQ